jgi:hypothetical protein
MRTYSEVYIYDVICCDCEKTFRTQSYFKNLDLMNMVCPFCPNKILTEEDIVSQKLIGSMIIDLYTFKVIVVKKALSEEDVYIESTTLEYAVENTKELLDELKKYKRPILVNNEKSPQFSFTVKTQKELKDYLGK